MKSAATLLKENKETIMTQWENQAHQYIESTFGQSSLMLRDGLPTFLDGLIQTLIQTDTNKEQNEKKNLDTSKKHGMARAENPNYSIDEVIFEYQLLRFIIFDVLEKDYELSRRERNIIITAIEQAINVSATEFSTQLKISRDQFINNLAHDLRSPLSSAIMRSQVLERNLDKPQLVENSSKQIVKSLRRIDVMISNLLDANSIRAGKEISLSFGEFGLNDLIVDVVDDMKDVYDVNFVFSPNHESKGFWSFDGLKRVLENLITNAIKYGKELGDITISTEDLTDHERIIIHNDGNPIPKEEQAQIFKRYHQRKKPNEKKEGWGLGLTLVEAIVLAHKGSINVESDDDLGTNFIIDLPKKSA
jgi:signal transduction histidine kinase